MSNSESLLQQQAETHTSLEQPLAAANSTSSLRENVETAMANYFKHLDGQPVSDVYQMVMSEIEAPLLEQVMKYVRNNQTKAAHLLGLNRGTLRKKLKQYGLL
tara:strand:- start:276 stop:584 length:309 start_codon:yes stop_codon:yes gene_type:complete